MIDKSEKIYSYKSLLKQFKIIAVSLFYRLKSFIFLLSISLKKSVTLG